MGWGPRCMPPWSELVAQVDLHDESRHCEGLSMLSGSHLSEKEALSGGPSWCL